MKSDSTSERRTTLMFFIPVIMMAVALLSFAQKGEPELDSNVPLRLPLPEQLPSWKAINLLYCQNIDCLKTAVSEKDESLQSCTECGAAMDEIPLPERQVLPEDTLHFRKQYQDDNQREVSVVAIISGRSRSSLHKPEFCLPGQGLSIVGETRDSLDMAESVTLDVTVLDIVARTADGGTQTALFIYWYSSNSTQTGSQFDKNLQMLKDNLLSNRVSRWAYVSMIVPYSGSREEAMGLASEFLDEFGPRVVLATSGNDESSARR